MSPEPGRKRDTLPAPLSHFQLAPAGWCQGCAARLEDGSRRHRQSCSARCRKRRERWRTLPRSEALSRLYRIRTGDLWRTPPPVFESLHAEWGFSLDCAATADDALCPVFIGPWEDGLLTPWLERATRLDGFPFPAAWNNPPYSTARGGLLAWMRKSREESSRGLVVVNLVPPSMGTAYMELALSGAMEIRLYRRRLAFRDPDTNEPAEANRGDSCAVIWHPEHQGPARVSYVDVPGQEAPRRGRRASSATSVNPDLEEAA